MSKTRRRAYPDKFEKAQRAEKRPNPSESVALAEWPRARSIFDRQCVWEDDLK